MINASRLLLLAALSSAPALATEEVHRLSPAEVAAIQERAAQRAPVAEPGDEHGVRSRAVHGEVGMAIGTHGYRSIFGTAYVPLGQDGMAVISVENSEFNDRRLRRR